MANSSKDSEGQKKPTPPAHNAFKNFMSPWWRDLGKSVVSQVMPTSAVQDLISAGWPDFGKSMVSQVMPTSAVQDLISAGWPDFGKSMVSQVMPTSAVQDLISAGWPDFGKSMVERMMPASAFEGVYKSLVPSERLYEHVMGQLIPPAVIDTLGKSEVNISSTQAEIVQTLSQRYLQDLIPDTEAIADEVESIDEEELQELFHDTETAWSDPVHAKFIKTAAGAGRWLGEEFPQLQQETNRVLSDLITRYLYAFIRLLTGYLGSAYGIPGLLMASGLAVSAGLINDKKKRALDREIILDRPCPYCDAKPGEPCVTKGGKNPGTKTAIHKARWQ